MRKLKADPNVEVIGAAMSGIIENIRSKELEPLLEKHELTEIDKEKWYPAESWIAVMNEMAEDPALESNYTAIGMKVAENVVMPPQLQGAPLGKILEMWDVVYKKQHRGDNIGGKNVEKLADNKFRIVLDDLYPDDMSYGVAYGWCRRFLPDGTDFTVEYEDILKRRDEGTADTTVLLIEWK